MSVKYRSQKNPYHIKPAFDDKRLPFQFKPYKNGYDFYEPFKTLKEDTGKQLFSKHVKLSQSGVTNHSFFGCSFQEVYSNSNSYQEGYSNAFTATEVYSCE